MLLVAISCFCAYSFSCYGSGHNCSCIQLGCTSTSTSTSYYSQRIMRNTYLSLKEVVVDVASQSTIQIFLVHLCRLIFELSMQRSYWFGLPSLMGSIFQFWLLRVRNKYVNLPKKQNVSWMSLSCLCETIYNVMIQFFGKIVESWDNYAFAANGLTLFNPDHVSNSSLNLVFRVLSTKAMNES